MKTVFRFDLPIETDFGVGQLENADFELHLKQIRRRKPEW